MRGIVPNNPQILSCKDYETDGLRTASFPLWESACS